MATNSVIIILISKTQQIVNGELEMIHLSFHCEAEISSAHDVEADCGERKI